MKIFAILFILFMLQINCMYDSNSNVVKLTAENFEEEVLESGYLWLVEFYAPWYSINTNNIGVDIAKL